MQHAKLLIRNASFEMHTQDQSFLCKYVSMK